MKWILLACMMVPLSSFAQAKKCLKKKDLAQKYSSQKVKMVHQHGHVVILNEKTYKLNKGYSIDIYAQKSIPVKDKKTNKISHHNKCLVQVKKNMIGTYIYGSFSSGSVKIRADKKIQVVSLR